jgi:hypothetical protein
MTKPEVQFCLLGAPLPAMEAPFAVLLDANDEDWAERANPERLVKKLLEDGCRFFVCFGAGAEALHDRIDDISSENDYHGILTTCHEIEPKENVANFFYMGAIIDMKGALVLTRDVAGWKALFTS